MMEDRRERHSCLIMVLIILVVFQIIVSILDILSVNYFIKHGVFGLFLAFDIFMAQRELSHQLLLIDIIISLYFFCDFFIAFLTYFQNGTDINNLQSKNKFNYAVVVVSWIFYAFKVVFIFFPYRTFKRIYFEQNPALNRIIENTQSYNEHQGKTINFTPTYQGIEINPAHRNNQQGTFEVNKGKGIVL